ncbi:type II toxin-antitoxin system RelE/ParE family toxin [Pseudonocardia alni subsp. carboxydivorans]|uniref:Type II toxin-antitoxin system RelE/ParE family toxin n=1 Tax=Pseudonocardia alni subsp. carboxydivorans TaxID=415010 RepID=A0ABU9ACW9_PSEA5
MLRSFNGRLAEEIWNGRRPRRFDPKLARVALRKLTVLHAAVTLGDLASPPGNRLEALRGDRAGQHSIRINDQWRICFHWTEAGPEDVEIVDYH